MIKQITRHILAIMWSCN